MKKNKNQIEFESFIRKNYQLNKLILFYSCLILVKLLLHKYLNYHLKCKNKLYFASFIHFSLLDQFI